MSDDETSPLESIAADKAAVDSALRALWPRLRRDEDGPLAAGLAGLLDSLVTLERRRTAVLVEDAAPL